MRTQARKIFSKMGAALMLGLSLFNLGAVWIKQVGGDMPKRIRQVRRRENVQLKPESQVFLEIAEQEGKAVIAQQQTQTEAPAYLAEGRLTLPQMVIRVAALAVWGVTASLFFTSMLFNVPLALGRAVMSVLPGVPHMTVLSVEPEQRFFESSELVKLHLYLNTNNDPVHYVKAHLDYDPNQLEFISYQTEHDKISQARQVEAGQGEIELELESGQPNVYDDESLVSLTFRPLQSDRSAHVRLQKELSAVLMTGDGQSYNVLGKVESTSFRLVPAQQSQLSCQATEIDVSQQPDRWKELAMGTPVEEAGAWSVIDDERALKCLHDKSNVYIIFAGRQGDTVKMQLTTADSLTATGQDQQRSWRQDDRLFYSVIAPLESDEPMYLSLNINKQVRWPGKGVVQMQFE